MYRSSHLRSHQHRRVQYHAASSDSYAIFNLLTGPDLLEQVESFAPAFRERLFPPTETLSMFLMQALDADSSCQKAVNDAAVKRLVSGLSPCSTHTGAYCRARQRLPTGMISALTACTGQLMTEQVPAAWRWQGRPVRLVDGATVAMPDTAANQAAYPQPSSQKPGLGFPQCRLVGIVCLPSGGLLNAAVGPCTGKGSGEQALLRSILDSLKAGDVLVGDAYFATYFLLCALHSRGVDGVFEQHGSRRISTDFRRGKRLGQRDHLIELPKPKKPDWMSQLEYEQAPASLTVRELRTGGKTLMTTLHCPKQIPKSALNELYRDRWHIELDLRNIKTTMGMDMLSCRTPTMIDKEIWVYLLAYNLIRMMMTQAALLADQLPRHLSFKHTVQLWLVWVHRGTGVHADNMFPDLYMLIAQQQVGYRQGRTEPRAVKRRPKPFPLLTIPRQIAKERVRQHGHPKKLK